VRRVVKLTGICFSFQKPRVPGVLGKTIGKIGACSGGFAFEFPGAAARHNTSLCSVSSNQTTAIQEHIHSVNDATERLERLSQAVEDALPGWKWEPVVRALMSLRGVQVWIAMTLVAEVGDFSRFDDPRSLMHFFSLTPSEHSSSDKRVQGGITRCGNAHCRRVLTEAAWHYGLTPKVSEAIHCRAATALALPTGDKSPPPGKRLKPPVATKRRRNLILRPIKPHRSQESIAISTTAT